MMDPDQDTCELSIIMPCLNEAETLAVCLTKAQQFLQSHGVKGEVVVADNGSTDGSMAIAEAHGARLVRVPGRGYGSAIMGGIAVARGRFVIMGDADDSYDFTDLWPFLEKLREGYDLVMGNRFKGGIKPGAMPLLHRYLGNPVLSAIGAWFFGSPCGDFHCGLRGFSKEAITKLNLQTSGMEFASEMVVKATLYGLRICEVPTTLSPDGRSRKPHLRSWRDGWRHLRFLLIYSPRWLFLYPGISLMSLGLLIMILLLPRPLIIGGISFDIHTLLYASAAIILGFQMIAFAIFSKVFAVNTKLLPEDSRIDFIKKRPVLEIGICLGFILFLLGITGSVLAVTRWESVAFGPLIPSAIMRVVIPSVTALILGIQMILSSFFIAILQLSRR
jgi:glycosyltransferase involved in cell wall biosynthesis